MIHIIYQDASVFVCRKPPGVLSQAGPGPNMPGLLKEETGCAVYPVHRLDRAAGGVAVYAKNRGAAAALSGAVERREVRKEYICLVHGVPTPSSGVYQDLLLHDRTRNKTFVVTRMRGGVREASLSYRVIAAADVSLVRVCLHTGRTHQIRVQFASRGTPLLGDGKYGGGNGPLALWSFLLAFPHPISKKIMQFSDLPDGEPWTPFLPQLQRDFHEIRLP